MLGEERGVTLCWHNNGRGSYLMMMLDYNGWRMGGVQKSRKKWLRNMWTLLKQLNNDIGERMRWFLSSLPQSYERVEIIADTEWVESDERTNCSTSWPIITGLVKSKLSRNRTKFMLNNPTKFSSCNLSLNMSNQTDRWCY